MLKFQFDALVKHFTPVRHKGQHRASGVSVCCGSREMAFRRNFVGPKSERLKLPKGNRRETEGKPKANRRQTEGKPKGNRRETEGKPKGNRREMAIEGSCLQVGSLKS